MHDVHAAEALVEHLRGEHSEAELGRIAEVRIRASAIFSPEALEQGYAMLTRGTPLEASHLVVEEAPCEHRCPNCGETWRISREDVVDHMLLCTGCATLSPIRSDAGVELLAVRARHGSIAVPTKQEELA
jgi:Zn finger protein HypA/HybF involved in hydrogenase expression